MGVSHTLHSKFARSYVGASWGSDFQVLYQNSFRYAKPYEIVKNVLSLIGVVQLVCLFYFGLVFSFHKESCVYGIIRSLFVSPHLQELLNKLTFH